MKRLNFPAASAPRLSTARAALAHTSAMRRLPLFSFASAVCLAACSTPSPRPAPPPAAAPAAAEAQALQVVPERYVSADDASDELDSLATWPADDGSTWLIVTGKSSHRLVVFDTQTGKRLRSVGRKGHGPGEFLRPNGIAVYGDHVFVAERDNHRVQVLSLPGFVPEGEFGAEQLRSPYGLWIHESAPDEYEVYVTDSFMDGEHYDVVPPLDQLDRRVRRYRVAFDDDGRMSARDEGAFGDTSEAKALRIVESIAGDPAQQRLLVADEDNRHASNLREYTFDGKATGRELPAGSFEAQAEGVALWDCAPEVGYWVAADQRYPLTHFLLFDRDTLAPRGSFMGQTTAETDGIALHAAAMPSFPSGALFAVHEDKAVAAFDLSDIVRALGLDPRCE
jgi:3-phytase